MYLPLEVLDQILAHTDKEGLVRLSEVSSYLRKTSSSRRKSIYARELHLNCMPKIRSLVTNDIVSSFMWFPKHNLYSRDDPYRLKYAKCLRTLFLNLDNAIQTPIGRKYLNLVDIDFRLVPNPAAIDKDKAESALSLWKNTLTSRFSAVDAKNPPPHVCVDFSNGVKARDPSNIEEAFAVDILKTIETLPVSSLSITASLFKDPREIESFLKNTQSIRDLTIIRSPKTTSINLTPLRHLKNLRTLRMPYVFNGDVSGIVDGSLLSLEALDANPDVVTHFLLKRNYITNISTWNSDAISMRHFLVALHMSPIKLTSLHVSPWNGPSEDTRDWREAVHSEEIFASAMTHAKSLRSFGIGIPCNPASTVRMQSFFEKAANLEQVSIACKLIRDVHHLDWLAHLIGNTRIRSFELALPTSNSIMEAASLPVSILTDVIQFLQLMPNIRRFKLFIGFLMHSQMPMISDFIVSLLSTHVDTLELTFSMTNGNTLERNMVTETTCISIWDALHQVVRQRPSFTFNGITPERMHRVFESDIRHQCERIHTVIAYPMDNRYLFGEKNAQKTVEYCTDNKIQIV